MDFFIHTFLKSFKFIRLQLIIIRLISKIVLSVDSLIILIFFNYEWSFFLSVIGNIILITIIFVITKV